MTFFVRDGKKASELAVPPVAIIDGGTGASDAATALTNLGGITDADHDGVDHTIGPFDLLDQPAHDALNHANAAGLGDRAVVIMTGDLVLTDSSARHQILDPNGLTRLVTLPAFATSNPPFRLLNVGLYLIRVEDSTGAYVIDLEPDQVVQLISDAVGEWYVGAREETNNPVHGQNYVWGGGSPDNNDWMTAYGTHFTTFEHVNVTDAGAFHVIHVGGVIDEVTWNEIDNVNEVETGQLYLDGVAGEIITRPRSDDARVGQTGVAKLQTPLVVTAGQRLAFRQLRNTSVGTQVSTRVRQSTSPGYIIPFGGNVTGVDSFYRPWQNANDTTNLPAVNVETQAPLVGSGSIIQVAYAILNASAADSLDIVVNGIELAVVPLTSGTLFSSVWVGRETIAVPFANNSIVGVRINSAAPDNALISLLTNVPGHYHGLGGNVSQMGVGAAFWRAWEIYNVAAANLQDAYAQHHVRRRGRVSIAYHTTNVPTADLIIFKNQKESYHYDWATPGLTQGTVDLPITVEPGDQLALASDDGAEGQCRFGIVIR
jgi:hypothetical protein